MNGKSGKLLVREMGPGDLDLIRELYVAVWNYARPRGYEEWRYFTPPTGICPAMIAMDGARAVGFYVLWPLTLRLGDACVRGAQSMDTMTHPDYQGRGLFTRLAMDCFDLARSRGVEVVYGFPNEFSYPGFVGKLGFRHTGDVDHWMRPVRPSGHAKIPRPLGALVDGAIAALSRGGTGGLEISIGRPKSADLAPLIAQGFAGPGICAVERTAEWLDWRYGGEAANGYEWVCASRAGKLIGAGVWGMRENLWDEQADGRAHLVELLGIERRGMGAVLSAIIRRAAERRAILLETLCNMATLAPTLRRAAFFRHRQAPFIVKSLTSRSLGADIEDHRAWRVMGGDVDTF